MAKVAIITRTKDRPELLDRTIKSVVAQAYDDYIHVVFNNGGDKQAVKAVLDKYDDKRIKLIHSDETVSRAQALNDAIKSVESEYVSVIDDDDTWHPDFLKTMTAEMEGRKLEGVVAKIDQVLEKLKSGTMIEIKRSTWMSDLKVISLYQQCIDNQLSTVGFVYTRKAYEKIGGYDETLNILEDYEFGIRFLMEYDVDLIDPGYSLANYHRRIMPHGETADNSFVADDHRYNFYKIANRMLRQEIREGRLGVGYIMSNVKYNQTYVAQTMRRVMPTKIVNALKRRAQD